MNRVEIKRPKKLIEVALPLDDINVACEKESNPFVRKHPRSLHIWWARRRLVATRAILFAQLVNDPGYEREIGRGVNKEEAEKKREELFGIIRDLVLWENTTNEDVLERARNAIRESWRETCRLNRKHPQADELFDPEKLPAFHDPFAGGGAIPLEAQRLGLESHASDLNPVAVLINKAMIEIPPKFAGRAPVGPLPEDETQEQMLDQDWRGARGLAEDVRRYGRWMREEARKRIGHLYPAVRITKEMAADRPDLEKYVGRDLTVIAWLWARTVKSPNPAYSDVEVPLVSSFVLSSKKGKEAYVEPIVENDSYRFRVRGEKAPNEAKEGTKTSRGAHFRCLVSDSPIDPEYVYTESQSGRLGQRLMAVVVEGENERIYLDPDKSIEQVAEEAMPTWQPKMKMPENPRWFSPPMYGMTTYGDLFTPRQLLALTTFSDLVGEARKKVVEDARKAGMEDDGRGLEDGGGEATAYAESIVTYLGLSVSRWTDMSSTVCTWNSSNQNVRATFARQAIPMTWDFAELSPFSSVGPWFSVVQSIVDLFENLPASSSGVSAQADAQKQTISSGKIISTDPPYYDNIGYADLSDFFYVWLRRSLSTVFPHLFATLSVPKDEELVATPYRHGGKDKAENFFLNGMTAALHNLSEQANPSFPVTIYYAFKQSETKEEGTTSTGWVTFLEAVIEAGFSIAGTWPIRTERASRSVSIGTNALASSIVLVCNKLAPTAETVSRRDFQRRLREELPEALETMIGGESGQTPIAPVDLAQAAIGPGMAIYSQYREVLNQDGSRMSVRDALLLINRAISEYLSPESGSFDADTQFCSAWFEQHGWNAGPFGEADTLARAKGTSVSGVREAGTIESGGGKVRLLKWGEYLADWDPASDTRVPVWEACHQMIRLLKEGGEGDSGELLARIPHLGEPVRRLSYHLYTICERKKWAEDARAYNDLIGSWSGVVAASHEVGPTGTQEVLEL